MAKLIKRKDSERINQLIASFEEKTHSELFVAINNRSDAYPAASLRFGIAAALTLTGFTCFIIDFEYNFLIPLLALVLFFFFSFIGRIPFLLSSFITTDEINDEVHQKAIEVFYERALQKTSHRASSMIYFSLLEKKLVVIIDESIKRKFQQEDLEKVVMTIEEFFKKKKFYEGIETGIETLERLILYYYPTKVLENKPNEIANQIHHLSF